MLRKPDNKSLCNSLLQAESEEDVIRILKSFGYWSDSSDWRIYGDNENNFSVIGNQQSNPAAAIVEKLVNSIDAMLMFTCYWSKTDPESSAAPQSITEAVERYFQVQDGNLVNMVAKRRSRLAENIGLIATGRKHTPNYIVFDKGEGQSPEMMPDTLLSIGASNKLRIPFVQGKFNMGGTGVLQFCGKQNLQLIISRRHPDITKESDVSAKYWGFTIVRRESPQHGRRSSMYIYLAPNGQIPRFESNFVELPYDGLPKLDWGTIIKLYEYEMSGMKTDIRFDLYYHISLLLPRPALPIRFYERRDYQSHTNEATMSGLHVRLEEDKRDNVEEGFPTHSELTVRSEKMLARIYAFKKGQAVKYRKQEGIIFAVNGQTHGVLKQGFFNRCNMAYLADSILVIVDCTGISGRAREDLFMNSRDRLRSGELRSEIESSLEEIIRSHSGLRELRERRRREAVENQLDQARPLRDLLEQVVKKSPALAALFGQGSEIHNPFKSRLVGEQEHFEGRTHPTYFRLKKKEEHKKCHLNSRFRVQFETDVENEYFGRDVYPGRFTLHINGVETEASIINLWNGVATLNASLPPDSIVGDILRCEVWVEDDSLVDPFYNIFIRDVGEPLGDYPSVPGKRLPPVGKGSGDRQTSDALGLPEVIEVRENQWGNFEFDRFSALKVIETGASAYDFYVNMDNVYLRSELKSLARNMDAKLLEARFKYGLVLISLALLQDHRSKETSDLPHDEDTTIEDLVISVTKAISPVLLPIINELGDLELLPDDIKSQTAEVD